MTTQYAEEQGFKKKYLAPLVVLLLCAVSLTGAAYAYSTTVTNSGEIDGDYISIDMYEKGQSGYTVLEKTLDADKDFQVYTEKTVGVDAKYTAKVEAGKLVYTTYVMVSSDIDNATFTLSGTVTYTAAASSVSGAGLVFSNITAGSVTDLASFMAIEKDDGTAATFDSLAKGVYYKVTITFDIDTTAAFGEYSSVDDLKDDVDAYSTDGKFTFTLKADLN
jgi:hypothetical protein